MRMLKTERLVVKNFRPEDWRQLQELIVWFMSSQYAAYDHPWPTTDEEIRGICQWFASTDEILAVRMRETGRFIGYVCLNPTEEDGVYNLGYCFNAPYHGQGYAFESCRALIDYAFQELKATKIVTGTAVKNIPSCKLLESLGMTIVKSTVASFRDDETGSPIEFSASEYELTRGSS